MRGDSFVAQQPAGIRWLHVHPLYLIGEDERTIVTLASQFREGVMPEPGGVLNQCAATLASIRIVLNAWSDLDQARRRKER